MHVIYIFMESSLQLIKHSPLSVDGPFSTVLLTWSTGSIWQNEAVSQMNGTSEDNIAQLGTVWQITCAPGRADEPGWNKKSSTFLNIFFCG